MDIALSPGVYGLLGANGAGKTTLMRMVCGVLQPSEGEILMDGHDIWKCGAAYCSLLGYLPQDFGYYPDFTVKEFMYYIAALKGLSDKKARSMTRELLEIVSLSDVANKKIRIFSGGMKQRLGIAQAVINNPKILVLDEPTAGLDPKERVRFRNLISDFSKDKIVILSTHIVSDVEYIADTILMMKSGKLLLRGSVEGVSDSMQRKVWKCVVDGRTADRVNECFDMAFTSEGETYDYYVMGSMNPADAENFYENRMEKVEEYLNMDYSYGNYSEADKEYFITKNEKLTIPFHYEYNTGWNKLLGISYVALLVIALVVCITLAPMFSSEYQTGADAILLLTKYGRSKLTVAKIVSSFLLTSVIYVLGILILTFVTFLIYGSGGAACSL